MAIRFLSIVAAAALILSAPAHATEINVLSTNALKTVLEDLGPKFEQSLRQQARDHLGHHGAAKGSDRERCGI